MFHFVHVHLSLLQSLCFSSFHSFPSLACQAFLPSLFVKRLFVKDPWVKVELSPPIVHFDVIYLQKKLHLKLLA